MLPWLDTLIVKVEPSASEAPKEVDGEAWPSTTVAVPSGLKGESLTPVIVISMVALAL